MLPAPIAEARGLLAELVSIPSPSGAEGRIVDRIDSLCAEWGLHCHRVVSETGRDSLVVGPRDPALVIAAHVDTIDPPWPAEARVEGDVVHGLGAVDDKGGVVACLLAARELERGPGLGELGVAFAFLVDEERGGSGSRAVALELQPSYAIALEATQLQTGVAEIGGIEGVIQVAGRSAHGARPDLAENAIDRAIELIGTLREAGWERHSHRLLGESSVEIASIQAGTDFNTVPDRCNVKVNVKVVPGQGVAEALALLEHIAATHSAHVELIEVTEPIETQPDSPLVTALDEACVDTLGRRSQPIGVPAWTDAHNFYTFAGAQVAVFGPGDFDCAHTPQERIDVREVVECASVFAAVARRGWR